MLHDCGFKDAKDKKKLVYPDTSYSIALVPYYEQLPILISLTADQVIMEKLDEYDGYEEEKEIKAW